MFYRPEIPKHSGSIIANGEVSMLVFLYLYHSEVSFIVTFEG